MDRTTWLRMHSPVSRLMLCSLVHLQLSTLLLWLRHRPPTHRFELSSPPHLLLWSWKLLLWLTLALPSTVTCPQENNAPWFHWHGDEPCLILFMVCRTQESELPRSSSRHGSSGLVSMLTFVAGLVPVYGANVQRFSDIPPPHSHPFQPLLLVLMSSTLTLSDHFHPHVDSLTC